MPQVDVPSRHGAAGTGAFLSSLEGSLDAAAGGHGCMVLVGGEAGIGKTSGETLVPVDQRAVAHDPLEQRGRLVVEGQGRWTSSLTTRSSRNASRASGAAPATTMPAR
jgi:hypothetical protein